jgi:hypothetical protein
MSFDVVSSNVSKNETSINTKKRKTAKIDINHFAALDY